MLYYPVRLNNQHIPKVQHYAVTEKGIHIEYYDQPVPINIKVKLIAEALLEHMETIAESRQQIKIDNTQTWEELLSKINKKQ